MIGIDNGITGGIAVYDKNVKRIIYCCKTPVRRMRNHARNIGTISRIDIAELKKLLMPFVADCVVVMERPMVNPGRFMNSLSAMRSLEATEIALEQLGVPYASVTAPQWQRPMKIGSKEDALAHAVTLGILTVHDGIADASCMAWFFANNH